MYTSEDVEDEREKYLGVKKSIEKVNYSDLYFDCGITEEMLEEAYLEEEDVPSNFRDLLPTDIGREVDKPEFYCKLCKVQTTSMGNFRDHLNGKAHKNNVEAFKMGKKITGKKKKVAIDPSRVGEKSVSKEMAEGIIEPIIGLSYITEYHSTSGILCVCNLCAVKFDRNIVVSHVTGIKHRLHYMKERKPHIYVHLKKFGGKKSQLSAFLDELSMDVEREDGRGLPTIKVYELCDGPDSATEVNFSHQGNDAAEVTMELRSQEVMLARRTSGTISFQDWVNEEFLKVKQNDKEKEKEHSPSPSIHSQGNYNKQPYNANIQGNPGNSKADMHSPDKKSDFSRDGCSTAPHSQTFYVSPPILYDFPAPRPSQYPPNPHFMGPFPSRYMYHDEPMPKPLPDPCPDPYSYRRDPYTDPYASNRIPYPQTYLDPDPLKRTRRVETFLDPDPTKRIPPKKDAPVQNTVVIDYGHGSSSKPKQSEYQESDPEKIFQQAVEQWEKDIQNILGKPSSVKAPDNLAMLSSTYSSPEKSPSPVRGKEPPKHKELPFSKSYLESKKLKDFDETRTKANAARDGTSRNSPLRSRHSRSKSPVRSRHSRPISPLISRHSGSKSPLRSRRSSSKSPLRSRYTRSKSPRRSRYTRSKSPLRSRYTRSKSPLWLKLSRPTSPLRSRHSRSKSPLRSKHSRSKSPLRSRHSRPISPPKSRLSRPISPPKSRYSKSITPQRLRHSRSKSPTGSRHSRSKSPTGSRHSRSKSPENLWHKKIGSSISFKMSPKDLNQPLSKHNLGHNSRSEFSPQRSNSPTGKRHSRSAPDDNYGHRLDLSNIKVEMEPDEHPPKPSKRQLSRSPERSRKSLRPETLSRPEVKKQYERNKQIEAILAEPNEEDQVDRIANLLIEFTASLSKEGCDTRSAMEKLFSDTGLSKALVTPKTEPELTNALVTPKTEPGCSKPSRKPTLREKVAFSLANQKANTMPSRFNTLPGDFGESDESS